MRAGLLRHRVEIQERQGEADSFGQPQSVWTTLATVWASVDPLSGRERIAAQQVQADTTHRIVMRAREVKAEHRILFGTRVFKVLEVLRPKERPVSIEILAKEEIA